MSDLILTHGTASQRITCPPRGEAVPAGGVTITLSDQNGNELLAATPATKGSLSSTLAVAAAHGTRQLTLANAAGISADQPLALTDAYGRTEMVWAEGGETAGDVVVLRDPLTRDYAVGATVKSAWIYYDADLSNTTTYPLGLYYVALFQSATWSAPRVVAFRVVGYPADSCPITYEHVRSALSAVGFLRDQYDPPNLDDVRAGAWAFITADQLAAGRDPATLRDPERLAQAGGYLAAGLFLLNRGGEGLSEQLAGKPLGTGGFFKVFYDRVLAIPHWFDGDQNLTRDTGETRPRRGHTVSRGW